MKRLKLSRKNTAKVAAAIVALLMAAGIFTSYGLETVTEKISTGVPGTAVITSESGMELSFDEKQKTLRIKDQYGYWWDGCITKEGYDFERLNSTWEKNVTSIANIQYTTVKNINPNVKTAYSAEDTTTVKSKVSGKTLTLTFSFAVGITFDVDFSFDKNALVCRVPMERVKESGKFQLVTMELLPYLGASTVDTPGYMVYPDGSGALKLHKSEASENIRNSAYVWGIYSDSLQTADQLSQARKSNVQTAFLPVFGIKNNDHALVCYSTAGEAESEINMHPAGDSIDINRMSFLFNYRTWYNIALSNIKIKGSDTAENPNGKKYNEAIIGTDHELRYEFLQGNDSDYSGMANTYRSYLKQNGALNKSKVQNTLHLSADLFMGAQEKGLFTSGMVTSTTVSQAEKLIETFKGEGMTDSIFTLTGWSDGGYGSFPQRISLDSAYGSKSSLNSLFNKHQNTLLKTDLQMAGGQGGFSVGKDVIKTGNQLPVSNEDNSLFFFNTQNIKERFSSLLSFTKSGGGLSLENIGRLIYSDYAKNKAVSKEKMKTELKSLLQTAAEDKLIAIDGANLYTLASADLIYNLPETSSEYFISDQSIPFVQMVLYGSIPYTSKAGNLSSDFEKQMLKWLEYGYVPYFELTYENSDVLKNTQHNSLFSSKYTAYTDTAKKAYELHREVQNQVGDTYMIRHEKVSGEIAVVTYENGVQLIINYSEKQAQYGDILIEPESYAIRK